MAHNACACDGGSGPGTSPPRPVLAERQADRGPEALGISAVRGHRHHEGRGRLAAAADLVVAAAGAADADLRARGGRDAPH
eukprot:CAMPEP_0204536318 /NCGR_PEP_ID=MMETSP0661-20131031/14383_1 /ASSEMBLY_ACC=CAM_ASM_000606 /TAXON_ID=109239 /ORGANISM="Alexandrium margalefi, Strain AMGDE01CS-322" /LENGTH=80 /DNA_ID=CAMNT_0051542839 /DNA_START=10 /DNA_END=250 /DNA_ORIENTATION=-